MKSNLFLRVIIGVFCIFLSYGAQAQYVEETQAKQWVNDKGRELLQTFGETNIVKKYAALDSMMIDCIDFNYISKFVMGRYWRQMTPEQQNNYQSLFQRYALSLYKGFPLDFDSNAINFDIVKIIADEKKTTVRTKINIANAVPENNSPISDIFVEFILHKNNNKIQIIDLKLGESSLILSYRSRFYEMITQNDDDIEWFLEDLSDITEAAERTNQEKLQQAEY